MDKQHLHTRSQSSVNSTTSIVILSAVKTRPHVMPPVHFQTATSCRMQAQWTGREKEGKEEKNRKTKFFFSKSNRPEKKKGFCNQAVELMCLVLKARLSLLTDLEAPWAFSALPEIFLLLFVVLSEVGFCNFCWVPVECLRLVSFTLCKCAKECFHVSSCPSIFGPSYFARSCDTTDTVCLCRAFSLSLPSVFFILQLPALWWFHLRLMAVSFSLVWLCILKVAQLTTLWRSGSDPFRLGFLV